MAFRGSFCVLELSMTPYNHVSMRSLSRSDHTGRQWQVWPDEVTLPFGGAEARSRRRQGGAGGPGSPRPRPDPSATHSSPPPLHILTCALAARTDQGGCCTLCDGGGQGAVPHPHGGCWAAFCNREDALSTKNVRVFACLRVFGSAWSDFKVEYVVETGQTPTWVSPL